jgi:geranylgeranylglycerol-phosphate geranylgeranyltransferase
MTDRWRGLLDLARPVNALAAGALTAVGGFVAGAPATPTPAVGPVPRLPALAVAAAATILATAGGNAINDYVDREIDRQNRPDRPIPRGAITPTTARRVAFLWFGAAAAFALVLPLVAITIAVVNVVLLLVYTPYLKGRPGVGNVVVAWLTGSAFLFGAAAVGEPRSGTALAALAAGATLAREIVKDVEDKAGDRAAGLRTLPIAVGERTALGIAGVALAVAVVASPLPAIGGVPGVSRTFGRPYLVAVAVADAVMLAGIGVATRDPGRGQRLLKLGMFLALGAFVIGRVTG